MKDEACPEWVREEIRYHTRLQNMVLLAAILTSVGVVVGGVIAVICCGERVSAFFVLMVAVLVVPTVHLIGTWRRCRAKILRLRSKFDGGGEGKVEGCR
jgi:O-antigen/teichoic acid export membrane protein